MAKTVNARFTNGVFTLREPVDFPECALVVLNIEAAGIQKSEGAEFESRIPPHHSRLLPGMDDPKRLNQLRDDQDVEHYQHRNK